MSRHSRQCVQATYHLIIPSNGMSTALFEPIASRVTLLSSLRKPLTCPLRNIEPKLIVELPENNGYASPKRMSTEFIEESGLGLPGH